MSEHIKAYLDKICAACKVLGREPAQFNVNTLGQLLFACRTRFPEDTLNAGQAVAYLTSDRIVTRPPAPHDITTILDALPSCSRGQAYIESDWSIKVTGTYGKHGPYWTLQYKNTELPCTLKLQIYQDMDRIENHHDECPLHDDEPGGECYCEAQVESTHTLIIDQQEGAEEVLRDWLAKRLG